MYRVNSLVFIATVLFVVGCKKIDAPVPDRNHVALAYAHNQASVVEESVDRSDQGYATYEYFPYSINTLLEKSLKSGDSGGFDKAQVATVTMRSQWVDQDLEAYAEFIPHLKAGGVLPTFSGSQGNQCVRITKTLERMFTDAAWSGEYARAKGAYWYAVFANSGCSWSGNRSTYISLLADVDSGSAESEIRRLQALPGWTPIDSENLQNQVCFVRKFYSDSRNNGPEKLRKLGLLKCASVD